MNVLNTIYYFAFLYVGISTNIFTGSISYLSFSKKCHCRQVTILRHGMTEAVEKNEFMNDTSENAKLSENSKKELLHVAEKIRKNMPDVMIVGPLERTKATFRIIKKKIDEEIPMEQCSYLRGINNGVWAGKTFEMLDEENLLIFLMRECGHNSRNKSM